MEPTTANGTFTNGGTATKEGNTIVLNNITAGDKVEFPVTVTNGSNVTVKYRMRVSYANDNGLFSQLKMKIGEYTNGTITAWEELQPGSAPMTLACSIELPTSATLQTGKCDISLLVEAVQGNAAVTDENYPASDNASLKQEMKKGGNVELANDILVEDTIVAEKETKLDMKGKTIANTADLWNESTGAWSLVSARGADAKITVDGNGKFAAKEKDCFAVDVQDGATVTIKSGTFIGNIHAVYVFEGTATVEGGFYSVQQKYNVAGKENGFVLNCYDANRANGTAKIIVKGGTFVNFNPADCWAEGAHTNFVADGYSVISEEQANGDIWYTVVKGTAVVAENQEALNTGITGSTTKDVTVVMPKNSTVTLDNGIANEGSNARDVVFEGNGSQTVDVITNAVSAEGGQLNYQRGSTFTFKNLTIQAGEGNFDGMVCDELVYENCVIKGKLTLYGKATFINCTFTYTMANQYSVWTWGGTDVTFEGCTFNTNGKAILLYGQATAAKPTNLVVNNCTFNDRNNGAAGKAAIETGNDYNATYTLTVNNATVNGFADGKNTGSKLWANKNSMDAAHLTVTIDGTKVQ
ncbi:MAG: hypothetical protein KH405_04090 [Firmicutes bacterium]|nr:hypothetical protein [Bacillota bacterium]